MYVNSLLAAGLLAISVTVSHAATVTDVGTAAGSADFVSSGGGAITDYLHPAYLPNSSTSAWVWDENPTLSSVTFTHSFDLTGFDYTTASLSGLWGADNVGTAYLNGTAISSISFGRDAFLMLTAFSATQGFFAGINTLSFTVINTGVWSHRNPAAFRAEALVTADLSPSPVPIPASGFLLLAGLGAIAGLRRRNRKA